jgi:ferrochelatase
MRRAIILFNLGGPDSPEAVQPFLFNLFNDPAIITLPNPLRWLIAKLIARRRASVAREIYAKIGGRSPLRENTEAQAQALEAALGEGHRCFVAMRYWRPFVGETVRAVQDWAPEEIVLLPLYPQFSSTTTASSLKSWSDAARRSGLDVPTRTICCYPRESGFVAALAKLIRAARSEVAGVRHRVLFSAHGLPEKIVAAGDPYRWQVEATVARLLERLAAPDLHWVICYQSRVGPLAWIGPSTDSEIARAGKDGVAAVVVPVAFVSEHSETLVELDIEYRHLAEKAGVPRYVRAATVGTAPDFIAGLAELVRAAAAGPPLRSGEERRICPALFGKCPMRPEAA